MTEPSSRRPNIEAVESSDKGEEIAIKAKHSKSTAQYPATYYPATPRSLSRTPQSVSHTPLNDRLPLPTPPPTGPTRPTQPDTPPLLALSPAISHTSNLSMYHPLTGAGHPSRVPQNQATAPNRSLDNALDFTQSTGSSLPDPPLNLSPSQTHPKRHPTRRIVTPVMTTDPLPVIPQHIVSPTMNDAHDESLSQEVRRQVTTSTFESTRQLHEALGLGGTRAVEVEKQAIPTGPLGGLMESFFASEDRGGAGWIPSVLRRPEDSMNEPSTTSMTDTAVGTSTWKRTGPIETVGTTQAKPSGSTSIGVPDQTAQAVQKSGDTRPIWSGVYPIPTQLPIQPETPLQYVNPAQTPSATQILPNYWQTQQTTPYASSSSSSVHPPVPVVVPGSTYMLMAAQMAGQRYPDGLNISNQPIYTYPTYPTASGEYPIPVQFVNAQQPGLQTFSPANVYARGINPREPHIPAPAPPTPLSKIPTPVQSRQPQLDCIDLGPAGSPLAQMILEPHEAALFSQLHGMDTPAEEPGTTPTSPASAWKQCGEGILKEYTMMKQYHLAALSDWMLGLPPHIRLKDVFQAEAMRRDPISGLVFTVPVLSTPFTVILEQYRLLDTKIVEHLERKDTALDEFELELRTRMEKGLKQLINLDAATQAASPEPERAEDDESVQAQTSPEAYERQPMATVEIHGQDNVRRHLQSVEGVHVYIDANGRVNTLRNEPHQESVQQSGLTGVAQSAPYHPQDIHSTSFPLGNIRSVDTNTAIHGMPHWLANPMDPTGESQGSVASTTTSTAQPTYTASQDIQRPNLNSISQDLSTYQFPTHVPVDTDATASGSTTTQTKARKSKAGKRKGDHIDASEPAKKTKKKQPSYH